MYKLGDEITWDRSGIKQHGTIVSVYFNKPIVMVETPKNTMGEYEILAVKENNPTIQMEGLEK